MTEFSYDEQIVEEEEELPEEDTNIYGEPEGLSEGYGTPVDGSSYSTEDDEEASYGSTLKNTAAKYQDTIGSAVGGAAGGALLFGTPELALLTGGAMGAAHVAGVASAKGMNAVKDYLDGEGEEGADDEQYAEASTA